MSDTKRANVAKSALSIAVRRDAKNSDERRTEWLFSSVPGINAARANTCKGACVQRCAALATASYLPATLPNPAPVLLADGTRAAKGPPLSVSFRTRKVPRALSDLAYIRRVRICSRTS